MKKYKIITDSSADITFLDDVNFKSVPLKIITSEKEYVDDENLDVEEMVRKLYDYKGKSSTACPSPGEWINAFGDADFIFCITITGALSGSYNSACTAKKMVLEDEPDKKIHIIDSLSAGPELYLIVDKIKELINEEKDFEEIAKEIEDYRKNLGLLFMLVSMKNLANNGRVSPLIAKFAGLLGIRIVGKANDDGKLEPLHKVRGKKALLTILTELEKNGYNGGKLRICHVSSLDEATKLKNIILAKYKNAPITIAASRGLCSFYAEKGGLMIGFEKINKLNII